MGCGSSKSGIKSEAGQNKVTAVSLANIGGKKALNEIVQNLVENISKDNSLKKNFIPPKEDMEKQAKRMSKIGKNCGLHPDIHTQLNIYLLQILPYGKDIAIQQQKMNANGLGNINLSEEEYIKFKINLKIAFNHGNVDPQYQDLLLKQQEILKKLIVPGTGHKGDYKIEEGVDPESLYAAVGGLPTIIKVVEVFYEHMLEDPFLNQFFFNTDMQKQEERQVQFMVMAFGGPNNYKGKDMFTAHRGMSIEGKHFDRTVEVLAQTITELGAAHIIPQVAALLVPLKNDICQYTPPEEQG